MSVQAMSWVIERSVQKGSNLLVLLMIANHADTTGRNSFPAVTTLAAESRLSERAVRYILAKLESSPELVIERDAGLRGTHLYSLPGVTRDGFNLRGLPAKFAGRKQEGKAALPAKCAPGCAALPAKFAPDSGALPAKLCTATGKSFAPEPKRTESITATEAEAAVPVAASAAASSVEIAQAFQALDCEPYGSREFREAWAWAWSQSGRGQTQPVWSEVMEAAICRCNARGGKVPRRFYSEKHKQEELEVEARYRRTPL